MKTRKELLSWKNRENNLKDIKRYHKFKVMFYRTNNLLHTRRVLALLEEILPYVLKLYPEFDIRLTKLIAIHHDNHEIVMKGGDIPLQMKLMMNPEELEFLKQEEIVAIEILAKSYPKIIQGYNYKEIALRAIFKNCIETQVVSFVDKIDGYCEAIHEVLAGNTIFLEPIINYNLHTFNKLSIKYDLIIKVFELKDVWFDFKSVIDLKDFFEDGLMGGTPHTIQTIRKKTLIPQYEMWKQVTLKNFGVQPLINQVEFHNGKSQIG